MHLKYFYPLACLAVLACFSSCSSIYMPNVPATPMFKERGEVYVAAHSNIKGNISGNAGVAFAKTSLSLLMVLLSKMATVYTAMICLNNS